MRLYADNTAVGILPYFKLKKDMDPNDDALKAGVTEEIIFRFFLFALCVVMGLSCFT